MTDEERINWLASLTYFTFRERRDPFVSSPTFDQVLKLELFTIPSQHIEGDTFREVVDAAIAKAGK